MSNSTTATGQITIIENGINLGIIERISAKNWYWLSAINGDRNYATTRSVAISSLRLRAANR